MPAQLEVFGAYSEGFPGGIGRLFHTTRNPAGQWTAFDDLEAQAGDRGFFGSIDCDAVGTDLHLVGEAASGAGGWKFGIWHAMRARGGGWTQFGDVERAASAPPGDRQPISVAGVAGELHVCLTDGNGVWHAVRRADGNWTPFGDVVAATGSSFQFVVSIDCAGVNDELHVVVTADQGGRREVFHAVRSADGSWTPFGSVSGQVGITAGGALSCTGLNGSLHVLSGGTFGLVARTSRHSDGTWESLEVVQENLVGAGLFVGLSCTGDESEGDLHVVAVTAAGRLLHALKTPNGIWTPFGDVAHQAGEVGNFATVTIAAVPL